MTKKIIFTTDAPAPIGPYNQAILIGNTLYTSGQIALNPNTMELVLDDIETRNQTSNGKLESGFRSRY
jgi:2-iminobutanoate/2-iminopropanoate deaminase